MSKLLNNLRDFKLTQFLGWSYTRYSTFQKCHRNYYYEYYAKYDIKNAEQAFRMKRLTTVPLEIGNVSHEVLRVLLNRLKRTAEPIDRERFLEFTRRKTEEIFVTREFEDIYYGKTDNVDWKMEILPPVVEAMDNFLASDRLQWLLEEALAYKEDWIVELGERHKFGECRIDGMKAYCKVDFLFPVGDELHIIDWKTGKTDSARHNVQLIGYAGWAQYHLDVDFGNIRPTAAYLRPEYREIPVEVNEYDMQDFIDRVRSESDRMLEMCAEPDFNIPLPKEDFKMTENKGICKFCKFRGLCGRQ